MVGSKHFLGFLFLLIALVSCAPSAYDQDGMGISSDIWNGQETSRYRDVVALTNKRGTFCSGVAFSPTIIFTAGHCLYENERLMDRDEFRVYFGKGDRNSTLQGQYRILFFEEHPDHDVTDKFSLFDFAYLVLEKPLPLKKKDFSFPITQKPALAAALFDSFRDDIQMIELVGFGQDEEGFVGQKRMVEVNMKKVRSYDFSNNSATEEDPWELLSDYRGSCEGDSGGPAFIKRNGKRYLLGISHSTTVLSQGESGMSPSRYESYYVTCLGSSTYGRIDILMDWFLGTERGQNYLLGL